MAILLRFPILIMGKNIGALVAPVPTPMKISLNRFIHACKNLHNDQIFKSYCKRVHHVEIITSSSTTKGILSTLGKVFSRRNFEIVFLFFP